MADDEAMPEIATNDEWRKIMVRARKDHGLTQETLGDKVGLSQVMISKIESGESGSSTYIMRICRVLSITPPASFIDEWQQRWSELGHVLRHADPEQAEATMRLVESMARRIEPAAAEPEPKSPGRK